MSAPAPAPERSVKLGPIELLPGVTPGNLGTLLLAAFLSIGLLTFYKTMQPYLFNVTLGVPAQEQGTVTGTLEFIQEVVLLLFVLPFGALADRIGRRPVFALGFLLIGVAYALFPVAESVAEFTLYRCIFAAGAAAVGSMLATVLTDYPQDRAREPLVAIVYILNGLGVVLFAVALARLPQWIQAAGANEVWAGRCTLFTIAAVCLVAGIAMRGLKAGAPVVRAVHVPLVQQMREGMGAARNPRIALAYATAFAGRGDIAVVGTYLALWSGQAAVAAGAGQAEATTQIGVLTAIVQMTALVWAGVFAWIAAKLHRLTALIVAMTLAAAGYLAFGTLDDPNSRSSIWAAVLLGIGQMSAILSSQVLIGQESPRKSTGAVIGVYTFFGAVGILFVSYVGGRLFDVWRPGAPFILMAIANAVVLLWAIYVRRTAPGAESSRAGGRAVAAS